MYIRYIIQGSPSGCGRRDSQGASLVENRRTGNILVAHIGAKRGHGLMLLLYAAKGRRILVVVVSRSPLAAPGIYRGTYYYLLYGSKESVV